MSAEFDNEGDAIAVAFVQDTERDLASWATRHPEHARTFALLSANEYFPKAADEHSRVRELGLSALAAHRPALTNMLQAVKAQGMDMEEAAEELMLPEGMFLKLHRRLVLLESVPAALIGRLAETLRRSADEVRSYLAQPPMLAAGASYRADETPETVLESFADALGSDPETTDAMRECWLAG
ncbi:MAG: hypothetical protein QM758_21655 [Armatimonas sp.]